MGQRQHFKRGDTRPRIEYRPTENNRRVGLPSGVSATFRLIDEDDNVAVVTNANATIENTDPATLSYTFDAGETDVAGDYEGEFVVSYSDDGTRTFPDVDTIPVTIHPELDADGTVSVGETRHDVTVGTIEAGAVHAQEVSVGTENAVSSYGPNLSVGSDGVLNAVGGPENLTISDTQPSSPTESDVWIDVTGGGSGGTKVYRNGTFYLLANAPTQAITDGLVSRFTFEGAADATTATDTYGSHDGTINGAAYTDQSQEGSHALSLDGTDDYVEVPHDYPIVDNADYTIMAWVYPPSSLSSDGHIFSMEDANNSGDTDFYQGVRYRSLSGGGYGYYAQFDDGSAKSTITTGTAETLGEWHHAAIVHTEGTGYELFVDGSSIGTSFESGSVYASTHSLYFGTSGRNTNYLNGRIDDGRVYSRALTASELTDIANGNE